MNLLIENVILVIRLPNIKCKQLCKFILSFFFLLTLAFAFKWQSNTQIL